MRLLDAFLDVLLAPVCLGCDGVIRAGDRARLLCRRCRTRLQPVPAPGCPRCAAPLRVSAGGAPRCAECVTWPAALACARAACTLAPPADRIVHQLKYRGWRALAPVMAERMAALVLPLPESHAARICVPVPTSTRRERERGYNQAALLAHGYARCATMPFVPALRRAGKQRTQTSLQPLARRANVAGAFAVEPAAAARLSGAHVVLVDDVLTTGATASECAAALAEGGACCVSLVTFARAFDARLIRT